MSNTWRTRQELVAVLKNEYWTHEALDGVSPEDPERYVLVQQDGHDGDYYLADFDTFEDAADYAGDQILDGWAPVALFDLDTAKRIELHVSTPVVTRAEEQGVMQNPLDMPDHEQEGRARA